MKICEKCGSTEGPFTKVKTVNMLLCSKHKSQIYQYGYFIDRPKSCYNTITKYDTFAKLYMYNKHERLTGTSLIDLEDVDKVKQYVWGLYGKYITSTINGKYIGFARFIMSHYYNIDKKVIDHIDGDTLDNRKQNLRVCTPTENSMNKISLAKDNTSGATGVRWIVDKNIWQASITVNGKTKFLGDFNNINEAIMVRILAEERYFGEFAPIRDKTRLTPVPLITVLP